MNTLFLFAKIPLIAIKFFVHFLCVDFVYAVQQAATKSLYTFPDQAAQLSVKFAHFISQLYEEMQDMFSLDWQ